MLAFVDRTPDQLAPAPRVAVTAVRLWARELARAGCPVGALRQLFHGLHAPGALWPAHGFFHWIGAHAARKIELGCPCCGSVSEDEALILSALFAVNEEAAEAALRALVAEPALPGARRRARGFSAELGAIGETARP